MMQYLDILDKLASISAFILAVKVYRDSKKEKKVEKEKSDVLPPRSKRHR
ncbi:hypothetical protein [Metabacillus fastidiosus]